MNKRSDICPALRNGSKQMDDRHEAGKSRPRVVTNYRFVVHLFVLKQKVAQLSGNRFPTQSNLKGLDSS